MEARTNRKPLEDRFTQKILREEGNHILEAQGKLMASRGFTTPDLYSKISTTVTGTTLVHSHSVVHRFIDMKTREVQGTKKKVKHHPIHNRILFGHMNNVVRRLSFEFTEEMKATLRGELEQMSF